MKKVILILSFVLSTLLFGEIQGEKSEFSYRVFDKNNDIRYLTFSKNDKGIYNKIQFRKANKKKFKNEILEIEKLWDFADKEIEIELSYISVGYPLQYKSVLKNYIDAFLNSKKWKKHIDDGNKEFGYDLIREIMLENNIYFLDELLYKKGYY